MKNRYDMIIIGGGVIGTSIAFHLAKRKKKVLLIEKTDLAAGASGSPGDQPVPSALLRRDRRPGDEQDHQALRLDHEHEDQAPDDRRPRQGDQGTPAGATLPGNGGGSHGFLGR